MHLFNTENHIGTGDYILPYQVSTSQFLGGQTNPLKSPNKCIEGEEKSSENKDTKSIKNRTQFS